MGEPGAPTRPPGAEHDHGAALAARPLMFASAGLAGLARMLKLEDESEAEAPAAPQAPAPDEPAGWFDSLRTSVAELLEGADDLFDFPKAPDQPTPPAVAATAPAAAEAFRAAFAPSAAPTLGAPAPAAAPARADATARSTTTTAPTLGTAASTYTVKPGDSLRTIAERHGVHIDAVLRANPEITDPNRIRTGQTIRIPGTPAPAATGGSYALPALLDQHRAFQQVRSGQRTLALGDWGPSIGDLQRALGQAGQTVPVTARFDAATAQALTRLQQANGLPATGKLDQATLGVLASALARPQPSTTTTTNTTRPVQLPVPWIHQFDTARVVNAGMTACYRACDAMLKAYLRASGVRGDLLGNDRRIDVGTTETRSGEVNTTRARADAARAYIDKSLDAGLPVIVGVSHEGGNAYNANPVTDHFVVITGRGVDAQGKTYYTFHDPGTQSRAGGGEGRFYVDAQGKLEHAGRTDGGGYVVDRQYEVSEVRRWAQVP